jgi:hypothetical protein
MAAQMTIILMTPAVAMETTMNTKFTQDEVIPVISQLIYESYHRKKDYIGRTELIKAFVADDQGGRLADSSWKRYEQEHRQKPKAQWKFQTKSDLVGNMIDWFSARYTRGDAELTSHFERVRMSHYWAYKPVSSSTEFPAVVVYRKYKPQQGDAITALLHRHGFTDVKYDPRGDASEPFTFTPPPWLATGLVRLAFIQGQGWHVDLMSGRYGTGTWKALVSHFRWLGQIVDELARI